MWKNIKNLVSAAGNVAAIFTTEGKYRAELASKATESVTSKLAERSANMRAKYEDELSDRKAGIKKPIVVKESQVPKVIIALN